jgi:hypothetical protein
MYLKGGKKTEIISATLFYNAAIKKRTKPNEGISL